MYYYDASRIGNISAAAEGDLQWSDSRFGQGIKKQAIVKRNTDMLAHYAPVKAYLQFHSCLFVF